MRRLVSVLLVALGIAAMGSAQGADVPKSGDHPRVKRFKDSEIIYYDQKAYGGVAIPTGPYASGQSQPARKVEGKLTSIVYWVLQAQPAHSSLEVFRNYQNELSGLGFEAFYSGEKDAFGKGEVDRGWFVRNFVSAFELDISKFKISGYLANPFYLAAKQSRPDGETTVALLVGEANRSDATPGLPFVFVRIIDAAPLKTDQMVLVQASQMAEALKTSGKVDLYGIHFDFDKAEIRADSAATLREIAKLLHSDGSLKLVVAGHTDNAGKPDYNQRLSKARAQAVVEELTGIYGIAPERLRPEGYGETRPVASNDNDEGRAKNRRVELSKM